MRTFLVERVVRTSQDDSELVKFTVLATSGADAARLADRAKLTAEANLGLSKAPDKPRARLHHRPRHLIVDPRI